MCKCSAHGGVVLQFEDNGELRYAPFALEVGNRGHSQADIPVVCWKSKTDKSIVSSVS